MFGGQEAGRCIRHQFHESAEDYNRDRNDAAREQGEHDSYRGEYVVANGLKSLTESVRHRLNLIRRAEDTTTEDLHDRARLSSLYAKGDRPATGCIRSYIRRFEGHLRPAGFGHR